MLGGLGRKWSELRGKQHVVIISQNFFFGYNVSMKIQNTFIIFIIGRGFAATLYVVITA